MSPGSSTESYLAFARIGLRENPGKNLNQVTCPDRESNPGHLISRYSTDDMVARIVAEPGTRTMTQNHQYTSARDSKVKTLKISIRNRSHNMV
ncbi:hypothetical protein ANN_12965 [Periplaneta americana]|uniref:Uncharacterized protein n=1 Tax=Periplaneta americana TaxID=6978 RepID=A0ABQ8TJF3_PERAM|nr:hypothetical protein ANN_12965 [Periplaneta americana]